MDKIFSEYKENKSWGLVTNIDLHACDPKFIRDAKKIKLFVIALCKFIKANRFGDCIVVHFGERKAVQGFSMVQLIESSLVSGHFANATNNAYIDIFSCKYYNPEAAAEFAKKFFKANDYSLHYTFRK